MASIYIFGVLGRNDVRVLTLISIGVVAGLHQEVGVVASLASLYTQGRDSYKQPVCRLTVSGISPNPCGSRPTKRFLMYVL